MNQIARILLLDHDDDRRDTWAAYLRLFGYAVEAWRDAADDLLQSAAKEIPDVVILDVDYPGWREQGVPARLSENPATRDVPVLATTSRPDEEDLAEVEALRVSAVLALPCDPGKLVALIEKLRRASPKGNDLS